MRGPSDTDTGAAVSPLLQPSPPPFSACCQELRANWGEAGGEASLETSFGEGAKSLWKVLISLVLKQKPACFSLPVPCL